MRDGVRPWQQVLREEAAIVEVMFWMDGLVEAAVGAGLVRARVDQRRQRGLLDEELARLGRL